VCDPSARAANRDTAQIGTGAALEYRRQSSAGLGGFTVELKVLHEADRDRVGTDQRRDIVAEPRGDESIVMDRVVVLGEIVRDELTARVAFCLQEIRVDREPVCVELLE
jgi:hypothetical protein